MINATQNRCVTKSVIKATNMVIKKAENAPKHKKNIKVLL